MSSSVSLHRAPSLWSAPLVQQTFGATVWLRPARRDPQPPPSVGFVTELQRRPGATVRVRVAEYLEGDPGGDPESDLHGHPGNEERVHEDTAAAEEPLEIRLSWPGAAARRAWVTMRTPGHDFEL